jgi:Holliday junction resolvase RusA-like endonuclease
MTTLRASFFVPGTPIPKARPRVVRKGKFSMTYTPASTREWEKQIATEFKRQCAGIFFDKRIALKFFAEIVCAGNGPQSTIRGDWENYAKACADALNGVAFNDDAQIVDGRTVKRRARKGEACGAYIVIEPAQEVQSALFGESDLWEKVS